MQLQLPKEVRPYRVNQPWGIHNPNVYRQFGFDDHNGVDLAPGRNKEVRAPFPFEAYRVLWQPNGGGNVLTIISQYEYDAPDGKPAHVLIDYMHLERVIKTPGADYKGSTGDLLAIADNTGFSTGPHTHGQYRWVRAKAGRDGFFDVERNTANNSFDPEPYRNGRYAEDYYNRKLLKRDLFFGVSGDDVRALQAVLNDKGFLVASYGPGSFGNESSYFGSATRAAVSRYQKANGINPILGYFGPITRQHLINS